MHRIDTAANSARQVGAITGLLLSGVANQAVSVEDLQAVLAAILEKTREVVRALDGI